MPAAVRAPANNDGPTVTWSDDRRPYARHRLLLSVVSTVFNHDRDSALSTGGEQELSTMATITVQFAAESAHDGSAGPPGGSAGDALWLLEQVRLGLRRVSVAQALFDAGVAIVGYPAITVSRSYPADGRIVSAHSFDVALRTILEAPDFGADEDAGLIERVIGEGAADLENADVDVSDPTPVV